MPAERAVLVVERYTRRLQLTPDTQIIGLLGFLAEHDPSIDLAAAGDAFQDFLKHSRMPVDEEAALLCGRVDNLNGDAGFLRLFADFAQAYEDSRRLPAPVAPPDQAPVSAPAPVPVSPAPVPGPPPFAPPPWPEPWRAAQLPYPWLSLLFFLLRQMSERQVEV